MIKILGYDPGTVNQGFALLNVDPNKKTFSLENEWTLVLEKKSMKERLNITYDFVGNILKSYDDIHVFASERIVVTGNNRDAQNRVIGVIILALPHRRDIKFYVPSEVKKAVCGYHKGSKEAVSYAVCKMLNLDKDHKFSSNHASDAAAIGITYLIKELDYPNGCSESNND